MDENLIQKIALFARLGAELVQLGTVSYEKVKALLASEGQDDAELQAAVVRLDAAIDRAKADAGL
jgi:hypothetical protein